MLPSPSQVGASLIPMALQWGRSLSLSSQPSAGHPHKWKGWGTQKRPPPNREREGGSLARAGQFTLFKRGTELPLAAPPKASRPSRAGGTLRPLQRQARRPPSPPSLPLPGRRPAEPAPLAADQSALPLPLVQPVPGAAAAAGKGRDVAAPPRARLGGRRQQLQPGLPQRGLRAGGARGPPGKPHRGSQPRLCAARGEQPRGFPRRAPQGGSGHAGDPSLAPLLGRDFSPRGCALVREEPGRRRAARAKRRGASEQAASVPGAQ